MLVCANCHGEIEAGLIESPPAGGEIIGAETEGRIARGWHDAARAEMLGSWESALT